MHMDNRVFNVNGYGEEGLLSAIELAFMQSGSTSGCSSWFQTEEDGLVLCWGTPDGSNKLPAPLDAAECLPMIRQWLQGKYAKTVKHSRWCDRIDHDGSDTLGWQVYVGEWGHVGGCRYAICAVKPAWCWHGK